MGRIYSPHALNAIVHLRRPAEIYLERVQSIGDLYIDVYRRCCIEKDLHRDYLQTLQVLRGANIIILEDILKHMEKKLKNRNVRRDEERYHPIRGAINMFKREVYDPEYTCESTHTDFRR